MKLVEITNQHEDRRRMRHAAAELAAIFGTVFEVFRAAAGNLVFRLRWSPTLEMHQHFDPELAAALLPKQVQKFADKLWPDVINQAARNAFPVKMGDGTNTMDVYVMQYPK